MLKLRWWKRSWILWIVIIRWQDRNKQNCCTYFSDAFSIISYDIHKRTNTGRYIHTNVPIKSADIKRISFKFSMTSLQTPAFVFASTEPEISDTTRPTTNAPRINNITITPTLIQSPRLWLESLPDGAYTVMRCDDPANRESLEFGNHNHLTIRGIDFHLQRLQESFSVLHSSSGTRTFTDSTITTKISDNYRIGPIKLDGRNPDRICDNVTKAYDDTIAICSALKNHQEIWQHHDNGNIACEESTIMLTILWYADLTMNKIIVVGHATRSNVSLMSMVPWNIVLHTSSAPKVNRQTYPQPLAKVSSWCQQRKPLESKYMPTSTISVAAQERNSIKSVTINEVILTQQVPTTNDIHLLEGLTSNLFVVYPNHVIRTAGDGVLHGYVRDLLIKLLSTKAVNGTMIPYVVDTSQPILLDDVHEWEEVFCTSSIRFIIPVECIYVPCDDDEHCIDHDTDPAIKGTALKVLWRAKTIETGKEPIWKELRSILSETMYW